MLIRNVNDYTIREDNDGQSRKRICTVIVTKKKWRSDDGKRREKD